MDHNCKNAQFHEIETVTWDKWNQWEREKPLQTLVKVLVSQDLVPLAWWSKGKEDTCASSPVVWRYSSRMRWLMSSTLLHTLYTQKDPSGFLLMGPMHQCHITLFNIVHINKLRSNRKLTWEYNSVYMGESGRCVGVLVNELHCLTELKLRK